MISYGTIGAIDMEVSIAFYDAVLAPLGATRFHSSDGFAGYKSADGDQTLWICQPYDKQAARAGNGVMIGLSARTRAEVDAFHAAALAHGGADEGAPGLREIYGPNIYLAYIRDPVGNKLSAICEVKE